MLWPQLLPFLIFNSSYSKGSIKISFTAYFLTSSELDTHSTSILDEKQEAKEIS